MLAKVKEREEESNKVNGLSCSADEWTIGRSERPGK